MCIISIGNQISVYLYKDNISTNTCSMFLTTTYYNKADRTCNNTSMSVVFVVESAWGGQDVGESFNMWEDMF
jgi:hypothetical protein